jgi:hypothetical protein
LINLFRHFGVLSPYQDLNALEVRPSIHPPDDMLWSSHNFKILYQIVTQWLEVNIVLIIFSLSVFLKELTLVVDASNDVWHAVGGKELEEKLQHPLRGADVLLMDEV